jgi:hypothetical protein
MYLVKMYHNHTVLYFEQILNVETYPKNYHLEILLKFS